MLENFEPMSKTAPEQRFGSGGSFRPFSTDLVTGLREYQRMGEHWARYQFIASRVAGLSVVEFGCGHGLGSTVIAERAASYVGYDTDAEAIAWANRIVRPHLNNAEFRLGERAEPAVEPRPDVAVALEVVEHVHEPNQWIQKLFESVASGGKVFISTPNGRFSHHDPRLFSSSHHVDEYSASELVSLLFPYDPNPRIFREGRLDHLDVLALLLRNWHRARSSGSTPSGAMKPNLVQLLWRVISSRLNGPRFWTISETTAVAAQSMAFTTIVVECSAGARRVR